MTLKEEVGGLREELIALRRDFHRHPELGLQEYRTSGIIEDYMKNLGYEVRRCTETGIIAVLEGGKPGKTILVRCDMDALPVVEETGLPFASENPGVAHACGHDSHAAIHLITAKIIAAHREEVKGKVIFLFQTNEEDAGAEMMINAGALDDQPERVFGFHIWSPIPTGKIGIVPGPIMASSWYFKIKIRGKGGHGGAPHTAVNPIDAAGHVLSAIKTMHSLEFDSCKPTVVSVCKIHAGEKEIIVPDDLEMEGSIRCLHDNDEAVRARFKELCEAVCAAYRCSCDVEFKCGNTLLNNDPEMAALVAEVGGKVVGKENVVSTDVAVMLGDDFAEFSRRIPGVYYFIGTRSEEAKSVYEHHNPHFTVDENSLPIAVEMQVELIRTYLEKE